MKTFPVLRKTTPLAKHFLTFYFPNLLIFNTFAVKIKCRARCKRRQGAGRAQARREQVNRKTPRKCQRGKAQAQAIHGAPRRIDKNEQKTED